MTSKKDESQNWFRTWLLKFTSFMLKKNLGVYLVIFDDGGNIALETEPGENSTGRIDFQMRLDRIDNTDGNPQEPDMYTNTIWSIWSILKENERLELGGAIELPDTPELPGLALDVPLFSKKIAAIMRREVRYEGTQVPSHPRTQKHLHVIRRDEAVLPK